MKIRTYLLLIVILAGAFAFGAIWAELKLWPYRHVADVEALRAVRSVLLQTDPIVDTAFTDISLNSVSLRPMMADARAGGGIFAFDQSVLVMSFRGEFFLYKVVNGDRKVESLDIEVDNGYEEFQEFAGAQGVSKSKASETFRFMDVIYNKDDANPALLVSHHQWHPSKECFTVRVSSLKLHPGTTLEQTTARAEDWEAIYDSIPCMPMKSRGNRFSGRESGGRIVLEDSDTLLLSIGDHGFDGWNDESMHSQDPGSHVGKIVRVDLQSGAAQIVSLGNRNPQGLLIDADGRIWSTEHGPQGGDELNLIRDGVNYGWPLVTYGSQYGRQRWPLSEAQNRHDGYERPVYAWLPSISVSNLIQVRDFVPEWDGDLMVSSLNDKTLHRLRLHEDRVIFDEPIAVGRRVRDLDQLSDGTIVFWSDSNLLVEIRPVLPSAPSIEDIVEPIRGEKKTEAILTIESCQECHSTSRDGRYGVGPNLRNVFGRKIAASNFRDYSAAIRKKTGVWDNDSLNAFLADVQGFAPGSTMVIPDIHDDDIRAVTIEYLRSLSDE